MTAAAAEIIGEKGRCHEKDPDRIPASALPLLWGLSLLLSVSLMWNGSSLPALASEDPQAAVAGAVSPEAPQDTTCAHCAPSVDVMPPSWRPWGEVQKGLSKASWSEHEARDAARSVEEGLDEMVGFFAQRPTAVTNLREDAVEVFVEVTYGGSRTPDLTAEARAAARRNLTTLIAPYLRRTPSSARCDEYASLLPLSIYAGATSSHVRLSGDDPRIRTMVQFTNAAYRACGSLEKAIGYNYKPMLAKIKDIAPAGVSELAIWSQFLIEGRLVPGLDLPTEARNFPAAFWHSLQNYPLVDASRYPDGARNARFYDTAYLATHIGYLITGDDRHPIYLEDSPALYRFLRENFYAVMEMGKLDLVAEFVDDLRQYGCTEASDQQVRDGTRYLLKLYHAAGDHWMTQREPDEKGKQLDDYTLIHKAWTGLEGLRIRVPEPPVPGTYGAVVRRWLPEPR